MEQSGSCCLADLPDVLTVEEAGAVLRIGRSAMYEAVRCGQIPSFRVGRKLRVPKSGVLRLLRGE